MQQIWKRIESWTAANTDGDLALRPGATDAELVALETAMGRRLPDDLRESFLIHDGQDMPSVRWFDGERRLHPLASIAEQWQHDSSETEVPDALTEDERARIAMFHHGRLPLIGVRFWDGDTLYADFIPGPAGRDGQLVYRMDIEFSVAAHSWREFLGEYARKLEAGELVYHKGVALYPEAKGCIIKPGADLTYGHDVLATFSVA
ncbi:MAG: SMI1/KNR4 family protein [Deltaproteobacteria bacterium]|nr:SMI1/KNR4 family protein [Deltaproteobacteria bacterium]